MSSTSLWYATRASGIVALVLLTLTMVLGLVTTSRSRARNWPGFAQQEIHRRISILAVVFLALHVLTSVLDTYVNIGWLAVVVPFASPYSRFWVGLGTVALDLMIAVFVSSLLRARLRPGTWRGIHWLAYASWPIALAHTFGLGTDAGEQWVIVLGAVCVVAVGVSLGLAPPHRWPAVDGGSPTTLSSRFHSHAGWRRAREDVGMSLSPSPAPSLQRVHHLLGQPADLQGHLDAHGPLNVARGRSNSWQHGLVASLEESGLTGRGGGAFPTSVKLAVSQSGGHGGIVVVNAMEGEPASSKDQAASDSCASPGARRGPISRHLVRQ